MGCKVNQRQNHPIVPGFVQGSSSPFVIPGPLSSRQRSLQGCARPVASVGRTNKKGGVAHTHCLHLYVMTRGKFSVTDSYLDGGHFFRWHPPVLYIFAGWLSCLDSFFFPHKKGRVRSRVGNGSRGGGYICMFLLSVF